MIDGMLSWSPLALDPTNTSIRFAGDLPETTVFLDFSNNGSILNSFNSSLTVDESAKSARNINTFTDFSFSTGAKKFASERVAILAEYLQSYANYNDASDVARVVQMVQLQVRDRPVTRIT